MSLNGEITAVHISRKSSLSESNDIADDWDRFDETRPRHRPTATETKSKGFHRPGSGRYGNKKAEDEISGRENFLRADSDQLDLEKLMHSVLDIDELDKRNKKSTNANARRQRPFSAHQLSSTKTSQEIDNLMLDDSRSTISDSKIERKFSRRHHITQTPNILQQNRTNFSFPNDKVNQIDRENQRLLREIMRNQSKRSNLKQVMFPKKQEPVRVKSAAAVNRTRFQSQIERENLAFLQRLEKVKPTKELSRDHLLREHFKKEQLSRNISKSKRTVGAGKPRRAASLNDLSQIDMDSITSRESVGSHLQRPKTSKRPISAKSPSKTRQAVKNEPVWEPGW